VNARRKQVEIWQRRGDALELVPGLFVLVDELRYDRRFGLLSEGRSPSAESLVP